MCIAIYKQINHNISDRRLAEAHRANPDGCGLMWAADGEIHVIKGCFDFELFMSLFRKAYQEFGDRNYIIHFRTASASAIGDEFCHPFKVNGDLWFVQNGNLYEYTDYYGRGRNDGKSDIQRFNDEILRRLPAGFLGKSRTRAIFEQYANENLSKFVFLDTLGRVCIINEEAGEWQDGIWYSNGGIDNYVGYGYSGAYYYNPGDIRHKGGLMSVQMLGENRKYWNQCPSCLGWYRDLDGMCGGCQTLVELREYTGDLIRPWILKEPIK